MWAVFLLLSICGSAFSAPVVPDEAPQEQRIPLTPQLKLEMIRDLQSDVMKAATLKAVAETIKLEQLAEDKLLEAAVETLEEDPSPERTEQLKEVATLLRRDKRAVQLLNGILGGSSGGGGGGGAEAGASAGSDSGSILGLVAPLLGSSSGGGGGGGNSGGDAGSGSGTILNLAVPLISSSSGGGGGDGEDGDAGGGAGGSSDLSSILGLVGPLLGSSSGGGGGGDGEAGASAGGGSDSGSILNLVTPLLGSSSGGSSGGDDGSGGGGGSGLGSILSLSNSSKGSGGGGGLAVDAGGHGQSILSSIKGAKFALVGDKIQLLMRVKFGILNKILSTITNKIASASLPAQEIHGLQNLQYPH